MAWVIGIVTSVVGTLIARPIGRLLRIFSSEEKKEPRTEVAERSVVAGKDQTIEGPVATGDQPTVAGQAGVVMGPGSTYVQQGLDEESRAGLVRMEGLLNELKERFIASQQGTAPVDTEALAAEGTDRTERLLAEAIELQRQHKEREAIECLLEAYRRDLPPQAKWQLHMLAGDGYLSLSEFSDASDHFLVAMEAARQGRQKEAEAAALDGLGIASGQRGDFGEAMEHFQLALAIAEERGASELQAAVLANLGNIYSLQADLNKAEEFYRRALALLRQTGNREAAADVLGNLGMIRGKRGNSVDAEQFIRDALSIREELGDLLGQASEWGNLGNIFSEQGDTAKSEEFHSKALAMHKQTGNRLGEAMQLGNLGNDYLARGDIESAKRNFQQALALFRQVGAKLEATQTQQLLAQLRDSQDVGS